MSNLNESNKVEKFADRYVKTWANSDDMLKMKH